MRKINLFCIPYAGGSAVNFHKWKQYLDPEIVLRPIELAGRGKRINEPFYKDVAEAVEDIFRIIETELQQSPFAIFGHSMGALISYELVQKIRKINISQPLLHLFLSGKGAPHVNRADEKKYHLMNDREFRKEVLELGGTPPEFFDHPELLEVFLPVLKNDFKIAETYIHEAEISPLEHNISIFIGKEDDLTRDQCEGWNEHTKCACNFYYFEGGHFFLQDAIPQIISLINNTVTTPQIYARHE
jgi:medium-chain acyl-[acyl-carrier-protein] hydrolase